jgi:hypothetical protein
MTGPDGGGAEGAARTAGLVGEASGASETGATGAAAVGAGLRDRTAFLGSAFFPEIFLATAFLAGAAASADFARAPGFAGADFTVPPFGRPLPDESLSAMTTP